MKANDRPHHQVRFWTLLLGLTAILALGESRADQWFLKIDGIRGELAEGRFAGWTAVETAGALVYLPFSPANGTNEPAVFSFEVRKPVDRTSPALIQQCGRGEPLRRVTLAYVLSNPEAALYRLTLDNVRVSSVRQNASRNGPGQREIERVEFSFDKIEMTCFDLDANGGAAGGLTAHFDQTTALGGTKIRPPFRVTIADQPGRRGVMLTWWGEGGRRYEIVSRAAQGGVWKTTHFLTAESDGPVSQFVPIEALSLFMRVQEVD